MTGPGLRALDGSLAADNWYESTVTRSEAFAPPQSDIRCDVAVVGGGLAGLSTAFELARRGYSVRLLEAGRLGSGASGRNGGQALLGLACDIQVVESQLGQAAARDIFAMTREALQLLRWHADQHAPQAPWQPGFLTVATSPRKALALRRWSDRMRNRYGQELHDISPENLSAWIDSPRYHGAVHDPVSGHLNPLQLTLGVARAAEIAGAQLHEHTPVTQLEFVAGRWRLRTAAATLAADHVVLAGNVLWGEWVQTATQPALATALGRMRSRIMPVGTYIACTEPLHPQVWHRLLPSRSAVCDTDVALDYFRPTPDHRLLFGGRVSYSARPPTDLKAVMGRRIGMTFPALSGVPITHAWGGFVDITMNRAPDFGRLGANPDGATRRSGCDPLSRVFYLQGFSGHGLALTIWAGRMTAGAIAGDARGWDLFSRLRHRSFPGGRRLRTPLLVLGMAWLQLRDRWG